MVIVIVYKGYYKYNKDSVKIIYIFKGVIKLIFLLLEFYEVEINNLLINIFLVVISIARMRICVNLFNNVFVRYKYLIS